MMTNGDCTCPICGSALCEHDVGYLECSECAFFMIFDPDDETFAAARAREARNFRDYLDDVGVPPWTDLLDDL